MHWLHLFQQSSSIYNSWAINETFTYTFSTTFVKDKHKWESLYSKIGFDILDVLDCWIMRFVTEQVILMISGC